MTKLTFLLGAALAAAPLVSFAKDYPLEFKTLTARDALSLPGSSGLYGPIELNKPARLAKEPAPVSKRPLYSELGNGTNAIMVRLDETHGLGKGYDQLILDLNRNHDLTDDPVIPAVVEPNASAESKNFGPIPAPGNALIGGNKMVCFVQLILYSGPSAQAANESVDGYLSLRSGWCLETTAEFDGVKRKVGLADGNCNFRLGDISTPTYPGGGRTNWYFQGGDTFLQDADNSGAFKSSPAHPENFPFFPMVYVDSKPYKIAVSADGRTLSVEPWSEPLAELSLQPQGAKVASIQVALENAPGKWQLLQAAVTDGKTRVPPGNYRLYACTIQDMTAAGGTLVLTGYKRVIEDGIPCAAGATTTFKCGAPLEAKVNSRRVTSRGVTVSESNTLLGRLVRNASQPKEALQQRIEARLVGVGGELYSSFLLVGKDGKTSQPTAPALTITDANGNTVLSSKMNYGWGGVCSHSWRVPQQQAGKKVSIQVSFDLAPIGTVSQKLEVQLDKE